MLLGMCLCRVRYRASSRERRRNASVDKSRIVLFIILNRDKCPRRLLVLRREGRGCLRKRRVLFRFVRIKIKREWFVYVSSVRSILFFAPIVRILLVK